MSDGVEPLEQETAALAEKGEEKERSPKAEELPSQENPLPQLEEETESTQTEEPPPVDIKNIEDAPVVDVRIEHKMETIKDPIPDLLSPIVPEPVADAVSSQPIELPVMEFVVKEVEGKPAMAFGEKVQDEQPKTVDVDEPSVEATVKPQEPSEVLIVKESQQVVVKESSAPKEIDKPEPHVPEVGVKPEEQSEVTEEVEKPKSVEASDKLPEPPELLPVKRSEPIVGKDAEDSAVPKEVDKPESVVPEVAVKKEEQSDVTKQSEAVEIKYVEDSAVVVKDVEDLESVALKDVQDSDSKEVNKTTSLVPEVDLKLEEQSVITEQAEKPESVVPEVEVKPEEQSFEVMTADEKPEPGAPDIEVKEPEGQTEVTGQAEIKCEKGEPKGRIDGETVKDEGILDDKVEGTTLFEDKKTNTRKDEPGAIAEQDDSITQEDQAGLKEDGVESSLPDVVTKAGAGYEEKETDGIDVVEVSLKQSAVEIVKVGEEGSKTVKTEGERVEKDLANEEVTEKTFEAEKTGEGVELVMENKQEETPAFVETGKDGNKEGVVDEVSATAVASVKESRDSGLEAKEKQSAKTKEDKLENEKEKTAKSDVQDLKPPINDVDGAETSQGLPRDVPVPAKPTQKQSNNILTKVRQSLVKAKKAIIGKSPSSKNVSSDTRGDIKVK